MPPEVNTRVIVELPWLFVCGLRHEFGLADLAWRCRIHPCCALEDHLVVRGGEARAEVWSEWNDLGPRRGRQKASHEGSR